MGQIWLMMHDFNSLCDSQLIEKLIVKLKGSNLVEDRILLSVPDEESDVLLQVSALVSSLLFGHVGVSHL